MKANIKRESEIFTLKGIETLEERYKAVFIGDFCLRDRDDKGWINAPAAVFYNENPPNPEYSKYFAIFYKGDTPYITAGESAFKDGICGMVDEDGFFTYSKYRHDYRVVKGKKTAVDGGRDYLKFVGNMNTDFKTAYIVGDHLEYD